MLTQWVRRFLPEKPRGLQTPCKQLAFSGGGSGLRWALLTRDSLCSTMTFLSDAPLAQLDRALDFGSSGRGFESLRARHFIQFEPPIRMEVEQVHPDASSGLLMSHFRRSSFAPVGKGFFSTRSTSKGISEAARILSEEDSHPMGTNSRAGRRRRSGADGVDTTRVNSAVGIAEGTRTAKALRRTGPASAEWEWNLLLPAGP